MVDATRSHAVANNSKQENACFYNCEVCDSVLGAVSAGGMQSSALTEGGIGNGTSSAVVGVENRADAFGDSGAHSALMSTASSRKRSWNSGLAGEWLLPPEHYCNH